MRVYEAIAETTITVLVWRPLQVTDGIDSFDLNYFAMEGVLSENWEDSFCWSQRSELTTLKLPIECSYYNCRQEEIARHRKVQEDIDRKFEESLNKEEQALGQYKYLNRGKGMQLLEDYIHLKSQFNGMIPSMIR
jgi:hypothetical protein